MATEKYTCRCGRAVNKITSYFKDNVRVTLCDDCAEESGLKNDPDVKQYDYEDVVKDQGLQTIDTREKQ